MLLYAAEEKQDEKVFLHFRGCSDIDLAEVPYCITSIVTGRTLETDAKEVLPNRSETGMKPWKNLYTERCTDKMVS
jgi:hypothetical protein